MHLPTPSKPVPLLKLSSNHPVVVHLFPVRTQKDAKVGGRGTEGKVTLSWSWHPSASHTPCGVGSGFLSCQPSLCTWVLAGVGLGSRGGSGQAGVADASPTSSCPSRSLQSSWPALGRTCGHPQAPPQARQGLEGGAEAAPRPLVRGGQKATMSGAARSAGTQWAGHRLRERGPEKQRGAGRLTGAEKGGGYG